MFTFPTSFLVFLLAVQQKGREKGDEHGGVFVPHCKENPIYVFLFWELRDLSPNFHVHVVSDLFFRRIGPHISCSRIGRSMVGIYKLLTDTWMWKLGLWPRNSFSGDICFEFSVLVLCSAAQTFLPNQFKTQLCLK
jgi:hypothetical protein